MKCKQQCGLKVHTYLLNWTRTKLWKTMRNTTTAQIYKMNRCLEDPKLINYNVKKNFKITHLLAHQCQKMHSFLSLFPKPSPKALTLLLHPPRPSMTIKIFHCLPLDHHMERNTLIKAESSKPILRIQQRTKLSTLLSWFLRCNHDFFVFSQLD